MMRFTLSYAAVLTFLNLSVAQPAAKPSLIPTPRGWREKTTPLPPRFADGMSWKGTEELRFAPGMYAEKSDSFLSYTFLFWLNPDQPTDAKAIERELLAYYRGLAKGVMPRRLNMEANVGEFTLSLKDAPKPDKR